MTKHNGQHFAQTYPNIHSALLTKVENLHLINLSPTFTSNSMAIVADLPTLGNICRDTQHFIQNASVQSQSPTCRSFAIPRICLPDPPSLYPSLIAVGAEKKVAKEMDRAYNARTLELRSYYENSINNALATLSDFPFPHDSEKRILDTFASLYLTKVKSWIEDGVTAYKSRQKPARPVASNDDISRSAHLRPAFNTVCTILIPSY